MTDGNLNLDSRGGGEDEFEERGSCCTCKCKCTLNHLWTTIWIMAYIINIVSFSIIAPGFSWILEGVEGEDFKLAVLSSIVYSIFGPMIFSMAERGCYEFIAIYGRDDNLGRALGALICAALYNIAFLSFHMIILVIRLFLGTLESYRPTILTFVGGMAITMIIILATLLILGVIFAIYYLIISIIEFKNGKPSKLEAILFGFGIFVANVLMLSIYFGVGFGFTWMGYYYDLLNVLFPAILFSISILFGYNHLIFMLGCFDEDNGSMGTIFVAYLTNIAFFSLLCIFQITGIIFKSIFAGELIMIPTIYTCLTGGAIVLSVYILVSLIFCVHSCSTYPWNYQPIPYIIERYGS